MEVTMQATYTKLRSGAWGVKVTTKQPVSIGKGDIVHVLRRNGEVRTETIDKVVWNDRTTYLCQIKQKPSTERQYTQPPPMEPPERTQEVKVLDTVLCSHCGQRVPSGDDWCMSCGRVDYE
jgi:hypothetical protein